VRHTCTQCTFTHALGGGGDAGPAQDPALFPSPYRFEPERWVPAAAAPASKCPLASTAAQLSKAAWFPAGTGAHQCPGVPLAELVAKVRARTHAEIAGKALA
jgi:cytochrome P450